MERYRATAETLAHAIRDPAIRAAWTEYAAVVADLLNRQQLAMIEAMAAVATIRDSMGAAIDTQMRGVITGIELRMDTASQERGEILARLNRIAAALELDQEPPAPRRPEPATGATIRLEREPHTLD